MYGLSATQDLSFFVAVDLLQVCVGKNEILLNFDRRVRLTILTDFSVEPAGGRPMRYEDPLVGANALFGLLHDPVKRAEATAAGGLRLVFASSSVLVVFDTSRQYESFLIRWGTKEIIV